MTLHESQKDSVKLGLGLDRLPLLRRDRSEDRPHGGAIEEAVGDKTVPIARDGAGLHGRRDGSELVLFAQHLPVVGAGKLAAFLVGKRKKLPHLLIR